MTWAEFTERLGVAVAGFVLAVAVSMLVILVVVLAVALFVSADTFWRGVQVIVYLVAAGTAVLAFVAGVDD